MYIKRTKLYTIALFKMYVCNVFIKYHIDERSELSHFVHRMKLQSRVSEPLVPALFLGAGAGARIGARVELKPDKAKCRCRK